MASSVTPNGIFTYLRSAILAEDPAVYVTSVRENIPASLPCVWILPTDLSEVSSAVTLDGTDRQMSATYEVQIFANTSAEAWALGDIVLTAMKELNFIRTGFSPVANIDRTIYRIVGRFRRAIGAGDMMPE